MWTSSLLLLLLDPFSSMETRELLLASLRVEKKLRQGVESLKISCDFPSSATVSPSPSPNRCCRSPSNRCIEANPQPREGGGFKTDRSPKVRKVRKVKRASRQYRAKQQLQWLRAFKGPTKIYRADESNFKDLVYEHTCQIPTDRPSPDVSEPISPATPQSSTSISTASTWGWVSSPPSPLSLRSTGSNSPSWDFISPLSSPITPRIESSNSTSPMSSPRHDLLCSEPL